MAKKNTDEIMKVSKLGTILRSILLNTKEDYQIWLSSDEEGNQIKPMHTDIELSVCIDKYSKRVILFPQH